jgi:hypothetical protein
MTTTSAPSSAATRAGRRWRLGLRGQLLLVFGLVLGLATLAAGGYQYRSLRAQLTHADDALLRTHAQELLGRVSLDPLPTLPLPGQRGELMRVAFRAEGQPERELFRSAQFPTELAPTLPPPDAPGSTLGPQHRVVAVGRAAAPPGPGAEEAAATGYLTLWLAHPAAPLAQAVAGTASGVISCAC